MNNETIQKLAKSLGVSVEQAARMVLQEQKRKEAGERYRQSQAYKDRLAMQKSVRLALKQAGV